MLKGGTTYRLISDQIGSVRLVYAGSPNPAHLIQSLVLVRVWGS